MIIKEKITIIVIITVILYGPISTIINSVIFNEGPSMGISHHIMILMGFGWVFSIDSFMELLSGGPISAGNYKIYDVHEVFVRLFVIFLLWASVPLMFLVTNGIQLRRRIIYMWLFCTEISIPLLTLHNLLGGSNVL